MIEEMKDYIIKYSRDEENILKMAEDVVRTYNLSENKQRLIVDILDYCGVSISEENDIIRNASIDCCIGTAKDCSFYVMERKGLVVDDKLKDLFSCGIGIDYDEFLNTVYCSDFIHFELDEDVFGIVAISDL